MKLTVIVPARNEEGCVRELVGRTRAALDSGGVSFRLILVDDGSTDATAEILDELAAEDPGRTSVIRHARSRGLGGAYKSALARVDSEFVTWIPADGEIGPEFLLEPLEDGQVLVPYPVGSLRARTLGRLLLSQAFQRSLNLAFLNRIRYFNGNAIYPTRFARGVAVGSNGYFFNAELLLRVLGRYRPRVRQVPFALSPRRSGESKALGWSSFAEVLGSFARLRMEL
jgi:glycosyltransferase involved in cell wall biosynthesis